MLNYKSLMRAVADHVNEWHLTDDDGVRRCGLVADCLLDQIQGYMPDDGLPEGHGDLSEEGHDSLVVEVEGERTMTTTNSNLRGVAVEVTDVDVRNPDNLIPDQVFADLVNLVLEVRHPSVRFLNDADLDIARNNGVPDVSAEIDYLAVVCASAEELIAELRSAIRSQP